MKKTIIAITLLSTLISCEKSQPECNGDDVKEVLFSIIKEEAQKEFEKEYFNKTYSYFDLKAYALQQGFNVEEYLQERKIAIKENAKKVAKEKANQFKFELIGTRVTNKEEDLKKCSCKSELIINKEDSADIDYTAQYTEEGQVYVELLNY